jgi:hypothetical protein
MVTKKQSKAEKLAALQEKMSKQDLGGGGAGYFSPKVGRNVIRVMPEVGDMDFFFQPVGRHYFPDGQNVYCPSFTTEKERDCPVCEIVKELNSAGDKASKKLASTLGVRRSWWMNVIDRSNPGVGPLIFTPGVTVFNSIISLINDPDYGDITDLEEGTDITIEREGQGLDTSYEVNPKRKESVLSADEADDWMDRARDLSWAEVSEDPEEDRDLAGEHFVWVYPYDRIVDEFGLDNFDQEEYEEDEEPTKQPRKAPKKKRPVKKEVAEEEEYDEAEEEDYVEEEEEPAEEEVKRRMTRRSRRK